MACIPQPKDKDWLNANKNKIYICCLQEVPQNKGQIQTKSEVMKKILYTNGDQDKARVEILISDKIDFEIKAMERDKKDTI